MGEELQSAWDACKEAGFELKIATYKGKTTAQSVESVATFGEKIVEVLT